MGQFTDSIDLETIETWFAHFGTTDIGYLRDNFDRFVSTRSFALHELPQQDALTVLDVGAHWLHQAFLYANDGHRLVCVDSPNTFKYSSVVAAAEKMGAQLEAAIRLDKGEGFSNIADDSIDLLLFCEILEHLAFNPIPMWKEIYRVLRPGARLVVTTPNAYFGGKLETRLEAIFSGEGFGVPVEDIFKIGTFGHHWKEYSSTEILKYFEILSPDFIPGRLELHATRKWGPYPQHELSAPIRSAVNTEADTIYFELVLLRKDTGIVPKVPWEIA